MIEFLTLFLGLLSGSHLVDLAVSGETVARVELRLDGETVGTAAAPPYRFKVDFGDELLPHRLEALAFDAAGAEVARSEQLLNLPQPEISLRIVLLGVTAEGRQGLLVWRSTAADPPRRIEVRLDGVPLAVTGGRHFVLPPMSQELHVLSAEIELVGGATTSATLLVGGTHGEHLTTQLTAVPVRLPAATELPPLDRLQGWVRAGGEPLEVMAVEQRRGTLVVVRDEGSHLALDEVAGRRKLSARAHRTAGVLGGDRSIRLLDPVDTSPSDAAGSAGVTRFPLSQPFTSADGGLPWVLSELHRERGTTRLRRQIRARPQRIADAVAAAGLTAAGSQGTRAVLLILGGAPQDGSQWSPEGVRRFLAALHVPLIVWTPVRPSAITDPGRLAAWGGGVDVSSPPQLLTAVDALVAELDRQRVLWVPGTVLPHRLALTPTLPGAELAD